MRILLVRQPAMSCSRKAPRTARERVRQKEWYPMPWDDARRTVHTETIDITYSMEEQQKAKRTEARRQRQQEYKIFYYGNTQERASQKIKLRDSLRKQIEVKEGQKEHFYANTEESERLGNEAKEYNQRQKEENDKKKQYYSTFRDFNKMLIELKAQQRKAERLAEQTEEKELLKHNPINWSESLW